MIPSPVNQHNKAAHIYLVDDDASMRTSISRMLREFGYVVKDYDCAAHLLKTTSLASPAVILLDVQMPDMSGLDVQEALLKSGCRTPIVFLSGESDHHQVVKGMKNGAKDFLFKPLNLEYLIKVVKGAIEWDKNQVKQESKNIEIMKCYKSLTPREREVCMWLVGGLPNKEIAIQLGRTDATIKVHKARVMRKMNAQSLQALVRMWIEAKLENC